jgi:DNA-directed RNA polymerase specialized sigma24 family protein
MRQILVDRARKKQAGKRAGMKVSREETVCFHHEHSREWELSTAASAHSRNSTHGNVRPELRYFGELSMDEMAQALNVSPVTVRRDLRMAEAWLHQEMQSR